MNNYFHPLTNPHPRMFEGIELRTGKYVKNPVLCPVCQGHGEWNSSDEWRTLANGRVLSPMKFHCTQCQGHGFVEAESNDVTCVHEWTFTKNLGNCYNRYTCSRCGKVWDVDSSG